MFFLVSLFLVVEVASKHKILINSRIRRNSILFHLFFLFYINSLPDDVLCKIVIWADDTTLSSSYDKVSYFA